MSSGCNIWKRDHYNSCAASKNAVSQRNTTFSPHCINQGKVVACIFISTNLRFTTTLCTSGILLPIFEVSQSWTLIQTDAQMKRSVKPKLKRFLNLMSHKADYEICRGSNWNINCNCRLRDKNVKSVLDLRGRRLYYCWSLRPSRETHCWYSGFKCIRSMMITSPMQNLCLDVKQLLLTGSDSLKRTISRVCVGLVG